MDYINKLLILNEQLFASFHTWIKSTDFAEYDYYIIFLSGFIVYLFIRLLFTTRDNYIYNSIPQNYFSSNSSGKDDKETDAKIDKICSSLGELQKKITDKNQTAIKQEQDNTLRIKSIYNDLNILSEQINECKFAYKAYINYNI